MKAKLTLKQTLRLVDHLNNLSKSAHIELIVDNYMKFVCCNKDGQVFLDVLFNSQVKHKLIVTQNRDKFLLHEMVDGKCCPHSFDYMQGGQKFEVPFSSVWN